MHTAQSAMEFIVLATFMLLMVLGFFAITSSKVLDSKEEANKKIAKDIAELAYKEIDTAKSVNDGYTRTFSMPKTVNGVPYTIGIVDNRELIVSYQGYDYIKFLPNNISGNITRGVNTISKFQNDSVVYVNSGQITLSSEILTMKDLFENALVIDENGNAILKGILHENQPNIPSTGNDEFIFKNRFGEIVAVLNLNNGNMFIKGVLYQNRATLTPSASSNDFIIKNSDGEVVAFIDEFIPSPPSGGNLLLKGRCARANGDACCSSC